MESSTQLLAANDQPAYDVPEAKQQKWQSLQNLVQKEYDSEDEQPESTHRFSLRAEPIPRARIRMPDSRAMW